MHRDLERERVADAEGDPDQPGPSLVVGVIRTVTGLPLRSTVILTVSPGGTSWISLPRSVAAVTLVPLNRLHDVAHLELAVGRHLGRDAEDLEHRVHLVAELPQRGRDRGVLGADHLDLPLLGVLLLRPVSAVLDRAIYPFAIQYGSGGSQQQDAQEGQVEMVTSQDAAVAAALTPAGLSRSTRRSRSSASPTGMPADGKLEVRDVLRKVGDTPVTADDRRRQAGRRRAGRARRCRSPSSATASRSRCG